MTPEYSDYIVKINNISTMIMLNLLNSTCTPNQTLFYEVRVITSEYLVVSPSGLLYKIAILR